MGSWGIAMPKINRSALTILMSTGLSFFVMSCSNESTTATNITPVNPPAGVDDTPSTQIPDVGERPSTDPICTIALAFPAGLSANQQEALLGTLIEQPSWVPAGSRLPAPDGFEPPIQVCLFVNTTGAKPQASLRLEYEDRAGRVQYTLKTHPELDTTSATVPPPVKKNTAGKSLIYEPSYFVNLAEEKFEIFFMPTWGFLTITGKKEADGFFHAKIQYIKLLNAGIEPYYLTYGGGAADVAKIQACTGDDGGSSEAKIVHPDRPTQPPVACSRAHRFIRSAYRGPYDSTLQQFNSHNLYTGNRYDYRVEMVRQLTDQSAEALADFQTVLGQTPKVLGTIKFKADQVWSGVAP